MLEKKLSYLELNNFKTDEYIHFKTTKEIEATDKIIGQQKGEETINFGLSIKAIGYNIYISGASGKTSFAKKFAKEIAKNEKTPPDLCYVYNYKNPNNPKALILEAGKGNEFKVEMNNFIDSFIKELSQNLTSEGFNCKKYEIIDKYQNKKVKIIETITDKAKEKEFAVKYTSIGIHFTPIIDGVLLTEEDFEELSLEEQLKIEESKKNIQKELSKYVLELQENEKETIKYIENLEYEESELVLEKEINKIENKYDSYNNIQSHLKEIKEDILKNLEDFVIVDYENEESLNYLVPWYSKVAREDKFQKYKVNVIVDNSKQVGAPVVVEYKPTYFKLVGEIVSESDSKNMPNDFMKIKGGLLHKSNGGYLILQVEDIISNYSNFEVIKKFLLTGKLCIEPNKDYISTILLNSLEPEPIDGNIKIILIGSEEIYNILSSYDKDFKKLFKVHAIFQYETDYNKNILREISMNIKKIIEDEGSLHFTKGAVKKIVEHQIRISENKNKISTEFNKLKNLLVESNHIAVINNAEIVTETFVSEAIENNINRINIAHQKIFEKIQENTINIKTKGKLVGQINALAVYHNNDYIFGVPAKITATTYAGEMGVINIEKESKLSGNIHSKGVQIIIGYLGEKYGKENLISFSCQICFEQNYTEIDGDSASSSELYAILSSLANVEINQEIGVTGSVNQFGEIQAVGGVTHKIEGFFNLCKKRGLTGNQGVIIPCQNINNLVLNEEVIKSVKDNIFHIYAISCIDEGIEILTGLPAGTLDENNNYPKNSINYLVNKNLENYYKIQKK